MQTTLTSDGSLSDFGNLPVHGPINIVIGSDNSNDFGGGTVSVVLRLEGGDLKTVGEYTSAPDLPIYIPTAGKGVDISLSGSSGPDRYIESSHG